MDRLKVVTSHLRRPNDVTAGSITPYPVSASLGHHQNIQYVLNKNLLLSPQQCESYERDGFLVIRDLVKSDDIDRYCARFRGICNGTVKVPALTIMKDVSIAKSEFVVGERAITKIQDFQFDPVLFEFCALPQIVKYVECFTGPNIMAMHTMLINKPPDTGAKTSRHPMHQDLHYFPFRPAERIVCAWCAMEKVDRSNGCLVVVPGSHKGELQEHGYPQWEGGVNKMYHGVLDYTPDQERVHLEMQKGDVVFFHPLLLHGSGTNRTQAFRKAISSHYAASECEYIDVRGTSQQTIAEEVDEIVKKRLGSEVDFNFDDAWRIKGKLVHGQQINL
ncbi:phytanoyl-CoA dioxygenase, peroxisomal-like [Anneissia japonica]|uniref:phytanoyl-CoA dioxygenase, peroxisomal-like n=1 Tax=Anneissia japonica TaxID=1529436 RepID=UPI0014259281|nr:phytanoyl-CoA dioxygenase, peroxisomal-like [Anneissia japonica]